MSVTEISARGEWFVASLLQRGAFAEVSVPLSGGTRRAKRGHSRTCTGGVGGLDSEAGHATLYTHGEADVDGSHSRVEFFGVATSTHLGGRRRHHHPLARRGTRAKPPSESASEPRSPPPSLPSSPVVEHPLILARTKSA